MLRFIVVTTFVSFGWCFSTSAQEPMIRGKTISEWIVELKEGKTPNQRLVAAIILALDEKKDAKVLEAFQVSLANETTPVVRLRVVGLVKNFKQEHIQKLVAPLADTMLTDKSPEVRAMAAEALGKGGEKAQPALPSLIKALDDPEAKVRAAAATSLGQVGVSAVSILPNLNALLKDKDPTVRLAAAFTLGRLGNGAIPSVGNLGEVLLNDAEKNVRKEAARSIMLLGRMANSAVPTLAKALLKDESVEVRTQIVLALEKMGSDVLPAVPALLETIEKDADRTVRAFAVHSLARSLGADLNNHLDFLGERLVKDTEGEVRLAIVSELGALGPAAESALPDIRKAESDLQLNVREAAKLAIRRITMPIPKEEPKPDPEK